MASPYGGGRGLRAGGFVRALGRLFLLVFVGFALGLIFGIVTEEPELLADHLRGESESVVLERATDGQESEGRAAEAWDAGDDPRAAEADRGGLVASRAPADDTNSTPGSPNPEAKRSGGEAAVPGAAAAEKAQAVIAAEARSQRVAEVASEDSRKLPPVASPPAPARRAETRVAAEIEVPHTARFDRRDGPDWAIQVGAFSDADAARKLAEGLRARYPVVVLPASEKGGRWRVRVQPIGGEAQARATAERLKRDERLPTWVTKVEGRPGS